MSNPLIRASDHYVLLEPDSKEKIVSKQEAILWLKNWLSKTETQTIYPVSYTHLTLPTIYSV